MITEAGAAGWPPPRSTAGDPRVIVKWPGRQRSDPNFRDDEYPSEYQPADLKSINRLLDRQLMKRFGYELIRPGATGVSR